MRVDHCHTHVLVPEQFLNGTQIVSAFEQMRRERVPKRMAGRPLGDTGLSHCFSHGALNGRLMKMMPPQ